MVQSPPSSQHPLQHPLLDRGVAVVGGGLAGLAVAIALHRSSLLRSSSSSTKSSITVLESSSEADFYDPTAGAGVQITPNGLAALQVIAGDAVVKQVLDASSELAHVSMILPSKAALYDNLMPLPDALPAKYPTVMIRWGVLRQILVSQLPAGSIVCNQTVTGYHHSKLREESSGSLVRLEISDTNNNNNSRSSSVHHGRCLSEPFSLVICANGAASTFRSTPLTASPTDPRLNIKAVVAQRPQEWLPASHITAYSYFCPVTRIACFCGPAGQHQKNQTIQPNGNHHNHTNKQDDDDWTYWAISVPMAQCPPAVVQAAAALVDHHNHHHNNNHQTLVIQQWLLTTTALASQPEGRAFADLIQATQPASRIYVQHSTTAELTETFMVTTSVTTSTMQDTTTMTNTAAAAAAAAVQDDDDDDDDSPMEEEETATSSSSMEAATTTPPASPNNNKRMQFLPMVLLGDAGHAMSASYGQATSFAWEDAATLVYALQKQQQQQPQQQHYPSDNNSRLLAALLEYSGLRRNRCIHMQAKSAERAARAVRGDPCHDITQWIHDWRLPDDNDDDIDNVDSDDNNSNNNIRNAIGNNSNNKDNAAGDQPMTVVG